MCASTHLGQPNVEIPLHGHAEHPAVRHLPTSSSCILEPTGITGRDPPHPHRKSQFLWGYTNPPVVHVITRYGKHTERNDHRRRRCENRPGVDGSRKVDLNDDNRGGYLHNEGLNGVSEKREDDSSHLDASLAADPKLLTTDARAHTSCAFDFKDGEARIH